MLDGPLPCAAQVVNLSAAGACLVLPWLMPPGTVFHLRLVNREDGALWVTVPRLDVHTMVVAELDARPG